MSYDVYFRLAPGEKPFSFYYKRSAGVRGFQKLINRWVKCLLTEKGSDLLSPDYGTLFNSLVGSNMSMAVFTEWASQAIDDCNAQLQAFDATNHPPDDERLAQATLARVIPSGLDSVTVYVQIVNAAGTALEVQIL